MKSSTVLSILYGLNLAVALVGGGFCAAFLGQLYAEDPLLVFDVPVAVWINGVIGFFALLILYLLIWLTFRFTNFETGFSSVMGDTFAIIIFILGGVATTAGLTSEKVFRLNCWARPMWTDVLSLCLPAAIGAAIAWGQVGLLLITLTFIIVTMRDYLGGWKESMHRLCHPARPPHPSIIHLDNDKYSPASSSFSTPMSTERAPLVGLIIPDYPPRGAPHRSPAHRPSLSESSGSTMSPNSPVSVASWSPISPYGTPHGWPHRLPPAGIYSAYADCTPVATQSYWSNGDAQVLTPPNNAGFDMDRSKPYRVGPGSLDLERLVTPPSPTRYLGSTETLYYDAQESPPHLKNPPPLPPLPPLGVQRLNGPPATLPGRSFGMNRAAHQRSVSSPVVSNPSPLEKEYAAIGAARLSRDFDSVSSLAPSWVDEPTSYPPEKHTYPPEKYPLEKTEAQSLSPMPPSSAASTPPTTPKMRRQFQIYNKHPPLPQQWRDQDQHEREQLERARRKLSLETSTPPPPPPPPPAPVYYEPTPDFSRYSDAIPLQSARRVSRSELPPKISPGEALALPLPPNEWETSSVRSRSGSFRVL